MQTRRWTNQSLPQTLQIAVFLLYANVVFLFINSSSGRTGIGQAIAGVDSLDALKNAERIENLAVLFIAVGGVFAGYFISNEKKNGYFVGLGVAALPLIAKLLLMVRFGVGLFDFDLVGLMFEIAMLALLVHPQSRSYVKLWFK